MKIVILNGSPRGDKSTTLYFCKYIMKHNPDIDFKIINIGVKIKSLEKNQDGFTRVIDEIKNAEGIIWTFPVYTFSITYQLQKFIELIFERQAEHHFKNKYSTLVATSMHFFDHIAYHYIQEICENLDMKFVDGFSATVDDFFKEDQRKDLLLFAQNFIRVINKKGLTSRSFTPVTTNAYEYKPENIINTTPKKADKKILLVTDTDDTTINLSRMIDVFTAYFPYEIETININTTKMLGGCLGCLQCVFNGTCFYKDNFKEIITKVEKADMLIYALSIKNNFFSSRFKMYNDRFFQNGHRITSHGKVIAYLMTGPYSNLYSLKLFVNSVIDVGGYYPAGFVSDEYEDAGTISALIKETTDKAVWALDNKVKRPCMFPGVGGRKIFRDLVYGMKWLLKEDHRFYKKNKLYDYPQNNIKAKLFGFLMSFMMLSKKNRQKIYKISQNNMSRFEKILRE